MIPILYNASERAFNTNGIGRLRDCISCIVTEERNGKYECEFVYPVSGKWYSTIVEGMIVLATHDDTKIPQPFRIYRRSAPIDGKVTFNARHISYDLNNVILNPFDASGAVAAMLGIETNSINANPFEFWTDKTTSANFSLKNPSSVRGILGGSRGSILDVYGGEYEFDKYTVKLHAARGVKSDVTIRYGKNLVDLEQTVNIGTIYDSAVPFWYQDGTLVVLDERIVASDTSARPVALDLTSEFENAPTQAQLRARAKSYLNSNKPWIPNENIKVDFLQLWQTSEYRDVSALQRVNLCDTVNVYYPKLGVTAEKIKVIKTVYNVLLDRYDEMELGEARSTFAQTILKQTEEQLDALRAEMITDSMMQAAIDHATELITGGLGGHVVFTLNAEGKPEEILIMDTADVLTAVNVWRFNKNGLGHSHSGYNGPFDDVALTADGKINANMITVGTLSANLIKGGTLKLGGGYNGNGTLEIYNADDAKIGTLDNTGAALTGDITIEKINDAITYDTLFKLVTFIIGGYTVTRYGLQISAKYGTKTGSIIISPYVKGSALTYSRNVIYSDEHLEIIGVNSNNSTYYSSLYLGGYVKLAAGQTENDGNGTNVISCGNPASQTHPYVDVGDSNTYTRINGERVIINTTQTTSNAANMYMSGGGVIMQVTSSSKRYKRDILEEIPEELNPERLYKIPVKTYVYRDEYLSSEDSKFGKRIIGFIAEDVAEEFPIACQYDKDGRPEMWNNNVMVPSMLKLIQEQKTKIDELEDRVSRLEALIERMS